MHTLLFTFFFILQEDDGDFIRDIAILCRRRRFDPAITSSFYLHRVSLTALSFSGFFIYGLLIIDYRRLHTAGGYTFSHSYMAMKFKEVSAFLSMPETSPPLRALRLSETFPTESCNVTCYIIAMRHWESLPPLVSLSGGDRECCILPYIIILLRESNKIYH